MKQGLRGILLLVVGFGLANVWANPTVSEAVESDGLVNLVKQHQPKTPVEAPIQNTTSPRYVVQLGAFVDQMQAVKWQEQLAQENITVTLHQEGGEHGVVRVRTGPFDSKSEAQAMALQLKLYGVQKALILPIAKDE